MLKMYIIDMYFLHREKNTVIILENNKYSWILSTIIQYTIISNIVTQAKLLKYMTVSVLLVPTW